MLQTPNLCRNARSGKNRNLASVMTITGSNLPQLESRQISTANTHIIKLMQTQAEIEEQRNVYARYYRRAAEKYDLFKIVVVMLMN